MAIAEQLVRYIFVDVCAGDVAAPAVEALPPDSDMLAHYDAATWTIRVHRFGANSTVMLHELAHALRDQSDDCPGGRGLGGARVGPHGSLFVAQLISLWERYSDGFDAEYVRERAAAYGIRVTDLPWVVPSGDDASRQVVIDALRGILRPPSD